VISIEGALCRQPVGFPTRLDIGGNTPSCNGKRRSLFDAQDRALTQFWTNRRADRELIEELRRFARGEAYDEQVLPEFDLAPVWRN
jgi:hypothetical protein